MRFRCVNIDHVLRSFPFLFFLFCLAPPNYAQLLLRIDKDSLITYRYSGGDEFNDNMLNTTLWKDHQWPSVNMSQEFVYTARNIKFRNGVLILEMTKKDSIYQVEPMEMDSNFIREKKLVLKDRQYLFHYAAGSIVSQQKYHYGFYELRFKVEEGKGVWPAFWFFGGNKNEEIDVFEMKGERNDEMHLDTHCPYGCDDGYKNKLGINTSWGGWMPVSDYLHEGFNSVQLEWAADGLTWYVNSRPLAWFKGKFANPMHVYLNTQVAKDGRAFKPGPDASTPFPNNFYVDYLRFWERDNTEMPILYASDWTSSDMFLTREDIAPTKKRGLMYSKSKFTTLGTVELFLNSKRKLKIKTRGDLATSGRLEIKSLQGNLHFENVEKNTELDLPPGDYELTVKVKKKVYKRQFKIKERSSGK